MVRTWLGALPITSTIPFGKYRIKGCEKKLIRLTKAEKKYLVANGARYFRDLHSTVKGNVTYATENERVIGLLSKYYGREYKVKR